MTALMTLPAQTAVRLRVSDPGMTIVAAEQARLVARHAGMSPVEVESAATIAAELAGNAQRHARGGQLILQPAASGQALDIVAFDHGPGTADLARWFSDGYSTVDRSLGSGLGSVARLATSVDAHSDPIAGTVVAARVGLAAGATAGGAWMGALGAPCPGEIVNGDAWGWADTPDGLLVVLADGLGHGPAAAQASGRAVVDLADQPPSVAQDPLSVLHRISARLRGTRGAAVTVAQLRRSSPEGESRSGLYPASALTVAGAGNVMAAVLHPDGTVQRLVIGHGTVGLPLGTTPVTTTVVPPGAVVVLHTDGLTGSWTLGGSAGLLSKTPIVIAAALLRDHGRDNDDAGIVVISLDPPDAARRADSEGGHL